MSGLPVVHSDPIMNILAHSWRVNSSDWIMGQLNALGRDGPMLVVRFLESKASHENIPYVSEDAKVVLNTPGWRPGRGIKLGGAVPHIESMEKWLTTNGVGVPEVIAYFQKQLDRCNPEHDAGFIVRNLARVAGDSITDTIIERLTAHRPVYEQVHKSQRGSKDSHLITINRSTHYLNCLEDALVIIGKPALDKVEARMAEMEKSRRRVVEEVAYERLKYASIRIRERLGLPNRPDFDPHKALTRKPDELKLGARPCLLQATGSAIAKKLPH